MPVLFFTSEDTTPLLFKVFCDFKSLSVSSQGFGYGYSLHGEELVK